MAHWGVRTAGLPIAGAVSIGLATCMGVASCADASPPGGHELRSQRTADGGAGTDADPFIEEPPDGPDAAGSEASSDAGADVDAALFDPATLPLTGWWRASYAASPWVANASAGTSKTTGDLSEATNPPAAGAAVNGLTPADFDGTNDKLGSTATLATVFSASAWSLAVLFSADTAATDQGANNIYKNPALFADDTTVAGAGFSTGGFHTFSYPNAGPAGELSISCPTGGWHLGQAKFSGGVLYGRVDGAAWTKSGAGIGNVASLTAPITVGRATLSNAFFDGKILEIMTASTALSDAEFDQIRGYMIARYALPK